MDQKDCLSTILKIRVQLGRKLQVMNYLEYEYVHFSHVRYIIQVHSGQVSRDDKLIKATWLVQ